MADWEEIKRLAADFQKVQLSSTSQKSEIIDLIFTVDGKEFLTPSHLIQDIRNELYVSGGRINLVELAKNHRSGFSSHHSSFKRCTQGAKKTSTLCWGQLIGFFLHNKNSWGN
jgi:hypothetical protein